MLTILRENHYDFAKGISVICTPIRKLDEKIKYNFVQQDGQSGQFKVKYYVNLVNFHVVYLIFVTFTGKKTRCKL